MRGVENEAVTRTVADMPCDAEKICMKKIANDYLTVTTSSSEEFLAAIDPDYAVISVGMGSEYGHPHDAALERISKFCPVIYRTDLNGEVICYSDGLKLIFECGS